MAAASPPGYSAEIAGNTIAGNKAAVPGWRHQLGPGVQAIENNTIVGNTAPSGGGISCGSYVTIASTIVAFNSSGIGNRIEDPLRRYNCVYGKPPTTTPA